MITDDLVGAFSSERLMYRAIETSNNADRDFIHANIENDPVNTALSDLRAIRPKSFKHVDETLAGMTRSALAVMVCLPKDDGDDGEEPGDPIGFIVVGYGGIPPNQAHHRNSSIGIALAATYQGCGYGEEAINWTLDWCFRFGGFHRMSISTVSYNERAAHLYQKLGFVFEGRSREAVWFNRRWYDEVSFGMLESEWERIRGLAG